MTGIKAIPGAARYTPSRASDVRTQDARVQCRQRTRYGKSMQTLTLPSLAMREHIGEVLRRIRQTQGRTLREVSAQAQVSLGYLSEIERGQKEASSELLEAICAALEVPLSQVLREVADRIALIEAMIIPDMVPDNLLSVQLDGNMTLQS